MCPTGTYGIWGMGHQEIPGRLRPSKLCLNVSESDRSDQAQTNPDTSDAKAEFDTSEHAQTGLRLTQTSSSDTLGKLLRLLRPAQTAQKFRILLM